MVSIESGISPEEASGAILAGQDRTERKRMIEYEKEQRQFEQEQQILGKVAEHQAAYAQQKTRALQDVNERAMAGDMAAKEMQLMEAEREGRLPEEKLFEELQGQLKSAQERGASPKELQGIVDVAGKATQAMKDGKENAAFKEALEMAKTDKDIFDEDGLADIEQRAQSGESKPKLLGEMAKARETHAQKAIATEHADEVLANLQPMVESHKGTSVYDEARLALQIFMDSGGAKSQPGKVDALAQKIGTILSGSTDDDKAAMQNTKQAGPQMPGLGGMRRGEMQSELESEPAMGFGGPDIPPLGADFKAQAQAQRAEKEKRYPQAAEARKIQEIAASSGSPKDFTKKLKAKGIPLTPELAEFFKRAMEQKGRVK